jgi:predicted RNase H-like nuclease (RuvC/YqgF family)
MALSDCLLCYKSLFSKSYIENCSLDSSDITRDALDSLDALEPADVFENFQQLISSLLDFKRKVIYSEQGELFRTVKTYESSLQTVQSDLQSLFTENKSLSKTIKENQRKEEELQGKVLTLTLRLQDLEKEIKNKDVQIKCLRGDRNEKIMERRSAKCSQIDISRESLEGPTDELIVQSRGFTTPHKKSNNATKESLGKFNDDKKQTIKSVKFEYFVANSKAFNRAFAATMPKANNPSPLIRSRPAHVRSTSDLHFPVKPKPCSHN